MEFSKDSRYLLTVGRDRIWCLFEATSEGFKLVQKQKDAHLRIIWCCSWLFDGSMFATGSWEGEKIWVKSEEKWVEHSRISNSKANTTSIAFFPWFISENTLGVIVGLDNGTIKIYSKPNNIEDKKWVEIYTFPLFLSHSLTVWRMKFNTDEDKFVLATCGNDNTVRVFNLSF